MYQDWYTGVEIEVEIEFRILAAEMLKLRAPNGTASVL